MKMNPLLHVPGQAPGTFRVGQRVRLQSIFRGMIAEVVEDRGNIGVGGRRLYAVKLRVDPWNEHTIELPEDSLEAVAGFTPCSSASTRGTKSLRNGPRIRWRRWLRRRMRARRRRRRRRNVSANFREIPRGKRTAFFFVSLCWSLLGNKMGLYCVEG